VLCNFRHSFFNNIGIYKFLTYRRSSFFLAIVSSHSDQLQVIAPPGMGLLLPNPITIGMGLLLPLLRCVFYCPSWDGSSIAPPGMCLLLLLLGWVFYCPSWDGSSIAQPFHDLIFGSRLLMCEIFCPLLVLGKEKFEDTKKGNQRK
jgi:hypothetical protein